MRVLIAGLVLAAALGAPLAAAEGWTDAPGSYNYYQLRGNREAMAGDFTSAIDDWKHAATLSSDPDPSCRGEFQRVQIQAAKDAEQRMAAKSLTKSQAADWYEKRQSDLWVSDKCDRP